MKLELKRLEQIATVVRTGSMSKAAAKLHMTQPALSRSIAKLEAQYDIKIFDRNKGGSSLTEVGKAFVTEAEVLLRQARSVDHNFQLYHAGQAGALTIGVGPLLASLVLPSLSLYMLELSPRLHLKYISKPPDLLIKELIADQIEIMLFGGMPLDNNPELRSEHLGSFEQIVVVRDKHPLATKGISAIEDIIEYPVLSGMDFPALQNQFRAGSIVCDNYHMLKDLTLRTNAVWISATGLIAEELRSGAFRRLNVNDPMLTRTTEVYVASRKASKLSPAAGNIIAYTKDYLGKPNSMR